MRQFLKKLKKNDNLVIILIAVIGMVLRLFFLGVRPPTFDEGQSLLFVKTSLIQMIKSTISDAHPPGYFFLLSSWAKINPDLFFLRFFSILPGTAVILTAGFMGKKLFGGKVGIITSLLVCLSPVYIFESTNARMYSLSILISFLLIWFFLQFLKNRNLLNFCALGLILILGVYTHYYFILAIIALNFFILLNLRKKLAILKSLILLQLAVLIFLLPLIVIFLKSSHPQLLPVVNSPLKIPGVFAVFLISWDAIQILKIFPFIGLNSLLVFFILLTAVFFIVFLYGLRLLRRFPLIFPFFIFYIFLPILIVSLYSFFVKPIFGIRSFILFSPPFYFAAALGLAKLKSGLVRAFLFLLLALFLFVQYQGFKKSWDSSLPYYFVKENSRSDDLFAYSDPYLLVLGRFYLQGNNHFALISTWMAPEMSKAMGYEERDWKNSVIGVKRLWYFRLEGQYFNGDLAQKKQKELEASYPIVFSKSFEDASLRITLFDLEQK